MKGRQGITILELLIAAAVLGILLAGINSILVSGVRAQRVTAQVVDRSEVRLIVRKVLDYHLRLAGYLGADPAQQVGSLCGPSIETSGDGSTVTVRYFEDREYGAATPINNRECTFESAVNPITEMSFSAGGGFLLQNGEPVIEGISGFSVIGFVGAAGTDVSLVDYLNEGVLGTIRAVTVEVEFVEGDSLIQTVPFVNRQALYTGTLN